MNTKRFGLTALLLFLAISLPLNPPQPQAAEKTLRALANVDLDTRDPHAVWALTTYVYMLNPVFNTLVTKSPDLELEPALAEKWTLSQDGRTWTFRLRRGVTFHDGEPFNAQAVKANIDRITDPKTFLAAKILYFKGVKAEVVDEYTVNLSTEAPLADMLDNLASIGACFTSPKALGKLAAGEKVDPIGTGPFRFAEYKQGESWTLEAFPEYWGEKPHFQRIIFTVVPESATRALMLETGETDLAVNFSPKDYERLKKHEQIVAEVIMPTVSRLYIGLNTKKAPFNDVRVRQALNYAVDKEAILKSILSGIGRVSDSPIATGQGKYHLKSEGYPFNLEKAKQLLREAGFENGFEADLWYSPGRYMADTQVVQAVQAYLNQIKVKVKLVPLEWAGYVADLKDTEKSKNIDMFLMSWGNPGLDADLAPPFHSSNWPPGGNYTRYKNEQVDQWLEKGRAEMNEGRRIELYHKIQKQIMAEAPWLFLVERSDVAGWTKKLKGIYFQIPNVINFNRAYFEK